MKKKFSKKWKASKKPTKQRKYHHNAPLHIKQKFMTARLSKDLQKKYNLKRISVKKGDTVKVARGQFKKKSGKITKVNLKKERVYIENMHLIKRDGTKVFYPIHPSNLIITELLIDDIKRKKKLEKKNGTPQKTSHTKDVANKEKAE